MSEATPRTVKMEPPYIHPLLAGVDLADRGALPPAARNMHAEPAAQNQHGSELVINHQWFHGIADVDGVRVQTQQGNAPGTGAEWYATYKHVAAEYCRFGNVWRTPAGAAAGKHIDRFQCLGISPSIKAVKAGFDPTTHTTTAKFLRCVWDASGLALPPGCTQADTCLFQEGYFPELIWEECFISPELMPAKITLRGPQFYAHKIRVLKSPGFRLYIDALDIAQVKEIEVIDSPGFKLTDARNVGLAKLIKPMDRAELAAKVQTAAAAVDALTQQAATTSKILKEIQQGL